MINSNLFYSQTFCNPIDIYIPEDIKVKCSKYAKKVVKTVDYRDSGQTDKGRIMYQHYIGKVGECAAYSAFKSIGLSPSFPDFCIHIGRKKNWDDIHCDIDGVRKKVSVKTQTYENALEYNPSWTFQTNPKRRDPMLLGSGKGYIVSFVMYFQSMHICRVFPPVRASIVYGYLRAPKIRSLCGSKMVVYGTEIFKHTDFSAGLISVPKETLTSRF